MIKKLIKLLKNKYFFTTMTFLVWMMFFDNHNFISQVRLTNELNEYRNIKAYYLDEIRKDSIAALELMTNMDNLERFAREKYLMKRDNEDIFLIIREDKD
ncbi:septum formation initiator family protein [candidate division KSB1 bacterium]